MTDDTLQPRPAESQGGGSIPTLAPITVRQLQPWDIADDPVEVRGIGTGFEGIFAAHVHDAKGAELALVPIHARGTGIWGNYHATLGLLGVPATPQGMLEVFEFSQSGEGTELTTVVIPITFGRALIDPYHDFAPHTVILGNTRQYPPSRRATAL